MNIEDELARQLHTVLSHSLQQETGSVPASIDASIEAQAESSLRKEEDFYAKEVHVEHIADMQSARAQRERYARWVFTLVAVWIAALFIILLAQGACPRWHQFSDKVLIALISSMTINLIGTLVIVLKYIFKSDIH